jgi:hypothetical protein
VWHVFGALAWRRRRCLCRPEIFTLEATTAALSFRTMQKRQNAALKFRRCPHCAREHTFGVVDSFQSRNNCLFRDFPIDRLPEWIFEGDQRGGR